ncbi:MAG: 3-dehydroquinate synthase [Calditrichia bacterium]
MKTLYTHLKTSNVSIPCHIGLGLWRQLDEYLLANFSGHQIFVIADSNLVRLYSASTRALKSECQWLEFPAGEAAKCREQKAELENELLKRNAGRDSVIVALGGGVTGDLAGYIAATLHRGIPLIQMPSSLLAQVDSSIGGKVGINHPQGKNLLGAFNHPAAIFSDISLLRSLPDEELFNGMAEVIKYAVILDDGLWELLEEESEAICRRDSNILEKVITRCAKLKIEIVEADEREAGHRSLLNWGHTVGHAIEKLSEYKIKHGFAIAAGMLVAAALSHTRLGYPERRVERLVKLLKTYHLTTVDIEAFSLEAIWNAIRSDKKARQQQPRFTLMASPGKPELFYPIERQELEHALKAARNMC